MSVVVFIRAVSVLLIAEYSFSTFTRIFQVSLGLTGYILLLVGMILHKNKGYVLCGAGAVAISVEVLGGIAQVLALGIISILSEILFSVAWIMVGMSYFIPKSQPLSIVRKVCVIVFVIQMLASNAFSVITSLSYYNDAEQVASLALSSVLTILTRYIPLYVALLLFSPIQETSNEIE